QPAEITAGPDGALWFTEFASAKIGRITTSGAVTEFQLALGSGPAGITTVPDGRLWFTESQANKIGRIDPVTGNISEFTIPTVASGPSGITEGPDGRVWFTESVANR